MPPSGYNKRVKSPNVPRGMTLLEVGLAISLGLILAAATAFAYNSAKEAAGDSRAAAKVGDLQAMVEASFSSRGYYPDATEAQEAWKARRTDATLSPWGGEVLDRSAYIENGLFFSDASGSNNLTSLENTYEKLEAGRPRGTDFCYYYRLARPGKQSSKWILPDLANGRQEVECRQYAVAISKHYRRFYFVRTAGR